MGEFLSKTSKACAFACAAVAGLIVVGGPAAAQPQGPQFMPLGAAAPAPVGYLNFCARQPDQCDLKDEVDVGGRVVSVDERSRELNAKYFWSVAFGSDQPVNMRLTPMAGAPAVAAGVSASTRGAYFGQPAADRASSIDGLLDVLDSNDEARRSQPVAEQASAIDRLLETLSPNGDASPDTGSSASAAGGRTASSGAQDETVTVQPLQANPALSAELDRVNLRINRAIRYVSDRALYGDEDYWHLPLDAGGAPEGDCKDYVLEKRRALVADGVPSANLSIAIVETSRGETHAVLLVTSDRGELVLDNLSSQVVPWQEVRYRWVERQAPGQALRWVTIG